MKLSSRRLTFILGGLVVLLFCTQTWAADLLPEDFVLEEGFQPGYGNSVGRVLIVQGEVVILHADEVRGYRAQKDLPLYKGDTLVSLAEGLIRFRLNDQSIVTLASNTKLVITRSVYEPKKKIRSSFLSLSLGKVHFWVKKLANFKRSQVRVKSVTAVAGVRGTVFALEATLDPPKTVLTNLGDEEEPGSTISTESIIPGCSQVELGDGFQSEVGAKKCPTEGILLSPEELDRIKNTFRALPGESEGSPVADKGQGKTAPVKVSVVDPGRGLVLEGFEEPSRPVFPDPEPPPLPPISEIKRTGDAAAALGSGAAPALADFPKTP